MSQGDGVEVGSTPLATRDDNALQGHWLLARLGKRVLSLDPPI